MFHTVPVTWGGIVPTNKLSIAKKSPVELSDAVFGLPTVKCKLFICIVCSVTSPFKVLISVLCPLTSLFKLLIAKKSPVGSTEAVSGVPTCPCKTVIFSLLVVAKVVFPNTVAFNSSNTVPETSPELTSETSVVKDCNCSSSVSMSSSALSKSTVA